MPIFAVPRPVRALAAGLLSFALLGCPAGPPSGSIVSVTISGGNLELVVGENHTLTAVVVSLGSVSEAVIWSSDQPTIASVVGAGELAALEDGTATITATSASDSSKSDSISVTVALPATVRWTRQFGTANQDRAEDVAVDAGGNVVVAGWTSGTLVGTSAGLADALVQKSQPDGDPIWTRQFGTDLSDSASGVAIDDAGNVIVAGGTNGVLESANAGGSDVFVRKYDPDGVALWTRQFGTSVYDDVYAITADAAGNIIVTGSTEGGLDGPNAGSFDAYVRKYDPDGEVIWTRQIGTAEYELGLDIAADDLGNLAVTGHTTGNLTGTNNGSSDAFVRKYSPNGDIIWTRQFGTSEVDIGYGVAFDLAGNILVAGVTTGGLEGDNAGGFDLFIRKFDPAGTPAWTLQAGTPQYDSSNDVVTDDAGNVIVTGETSGGFGGDNAGSADVLVSKYDPDGNPVWTRQFGTGAADNGWAIAAVASGDLLVAGWTAGDLVGENAGIDDIFVRRYGR